MFLENPVNHNEQFGWIEVICGSMFSGKTEELIRRLKRAQFANQKIEIFKPAIDQRYDDQMVTSHDSNKIPSTSVPAAANILLLANDCEVVGIDEAQFFDPEIVEVCNDLANRGIRVIVAGLDMDYKGNPFGPNARIDGYSRIRDQSPRRLHPDRKFGPLQPSKIGSKRLGRFRRKRGLRAIEPGCFPKDIKKGEGK